MVPESPKVFLLGATGYIGGSIFQALINLPTPPSSITALIRDPLKASQFTSLSTPHTTLHSIVGTLSNSADGKAIAQAAEESDVVINAATADEESWLIPVFEGIKRRKESTGEGGVFIHTSGTGMFQDTAMGMYEGDQVSNLYSYLTSSLSSLLLDHSPSSSHSY